MRDFRAYEIPKPGAIDPGMVFLLRAWAKLELVEAGIQSPHDAIMDLAPAFYDLVHPLCDCAREIYERMERLYPDVPPKPRKRPA